VYFARRRFDVSRLNDTLFHADQDLTSLMCASFLAASAHVRPYSIDFAVSGGEHDYMATKRNKA
jgi:hypothetical protein